MERRRRKKKPKWANRLKVKDPITFPSGEEEDEEEKEISHGQGEEETRDWSGLLDPFLLSILSRLTTLQDFFAFRGVCRSWRSISSPTPESLSSQPPLLLFTCTRTLTRAHKAFYDVTGKRLYGAVRHWEPAFRNPLGYSHGFVISSTLWPRQRLFFWNIFTREKFHLPTSLIRFNRAIFSSSPASPDCLVLMLERSDLYMSSTLQYCRIGDRRWSVHCFDPHSIKDLIFFQGKIYALTKGARLGVVRLVPSPKLTLLEANNAGSIDMEALARRRWCLADLGQELMLVCIRHGDDFVIRFDLWRWDFERGGWVDVSDLGGRALFMRSHKRYNGFAASLDPSKLGLRGNCIYYLRGCGTELVVYCLEDQMTTVEDTALLDDVPIEEAPVWVFPSLC